MTKEVEHEITVDTPPDMAYQLLAEVSRWPQIFPPTIHVEYLERNERDEHLQIWALANGEAKTWTSRRKLDPKNHRITFAQDVSTPPVASMDGTWIIEQFGADRSRVRLVHSYRAVDDDSAGLRWIDEAVDRNSRSELAALKVNLEHAHAGSDVAFSFEDSVAVDGPATALFRFVNDGQLWPERLPHVGRVLLDEPAPGLQTLEMDTVAKDGSQHTTKSYRVCIPDRKIAYKQVTLPALMTLHTGCWTFVEEDGTTTATSQHTVVLNTENVTTVLGADATVESAKQYVRKALGTNSMATLEHAKTFAESGVHG